CRRERPVSWTWLDDGDASKLYAEYPIVNLTGCNPPDLKRTKFHIIVRLSANVSFPEAFKALLSRRNVGMS
ncbi:MAG TPA: hypothetical protein VLM43_08090, partial [Desulfobacterales bacterium]|nr:hypothetical protein [Desulfobacterales bacterium]